MATGALIAKRVSDDPRALREKRNPIFRAHFVAVNGLVSCIPNAENDATFGG